MVVGPKAEADVLGWGVSCRQREEQGPRQGPVPGGRSLDLMVLRCVQPKTLTLVGCRRGRG